VVTIKEEDTGWGWGGLRPYLLAGPIGVSNAAGESLHPGEREESVSLSRRKPTTMPLCAPGLPATYGLRGWCFRASPGFRYAKKIRVGSDFGLFKHMATKV
jgi:hypothetical protein